MPKNGKIWRVTIKSEKDMEKTQYKDGFIFPCSEKCLVAPSCKLYCYRVFQYMNFIANEIYTMTADQIKTYRDTTPPVVKRKIQEFYTYDKRLAHPETATVSRDWR